MDTKELCKFLVKAKINTYASGTQGTILSDRSKELVYAEGRFLYRDRYFGFNPFIGEETIFYKGLCIWGMNYYGRATSPQDSSLKDLYAFLRDALKRVNEEKPFRGPEKYEKQPFRYVNEVEGNASSFHGTEKIFYMEEEVYKLLYHGGSIRGEP